MKKGSVEKDSLLSIFLLYSVTLQIAELQRAGGPSDADRERAAAFASVLGPSGDNLLFRSEQPGRTADLANELAFAVAVLAFQPGGIEVFGRHFEAKTPAAAR